MLGGIFLPGDGQADPVGVTNLLAKAAKKEGVKIFEKSPVQKVLKIIPFSTLRIGIFLIIG